MLPDCMELSWLAQGSGQWAALQEGLAVWTLTNAGEARCNSIIHQGSLCLQSVKLSQQAVLDQNVHLHEISAQGLSCFAISLSISTWPRLPAPAQLAHKKLQVRHRSLKLDPLYNGHDSRQSRHLETRQRLKRSADGVQWS